MHPDKWISKHKHSKFNTAGLLIHWLCNFLDWMSHICFSFLLFQKLRNGEHLFCAVFLMGFFLFVVGLETHLRFFMVACFSSSNCARRFNSRLIWTRTQHSFSIIPMSFNCKVFSGQRMLGVLFLVFILLEELDLLTVWGHDTWCARYF